MQSYIIHMSSSTARRANAQRLLNTLPDAHLIEAVNGRDPAQIAHIRTHAGNLYAPHYPFALIAEDDLQVDPDRLAIALQMVADHATPDMYIRLPVKARETAQSTLAQEGDMAFILPRVVGLQCICQIVGRDAAQRLLECTREIDRPVDTFLQMHWVTGQKVHAILPNGNQEVAAQIGGSTIQVKTRASGKLARELKRAWYRAQVALRPQKI